MAARRDKRPRVATGEDRGDRGGGDGSTVDETVADMKTEVVALRSEVKTNTRTLQEILVMLAPCSYVKVQVEVQVQLSVVWWLWALRRRSCSAN